MIEQRTDFEALLAAVRRNFWLFALATFVGLGLALGLMLIQGPTWEAETSVIISPLDDPPRSSLYGVEVLDLNVVGTYVQVLRSRQVTRDAAQLLATRYELELLEDAVIDVRPVENSSVVVVAVRSSDRELAVELADAVVRRAMVGNPVPVLARAYPLVVLDPASTGDKPVAPDLRIGLVLGTLAGGILGMGFATLRDRRRAPNVEHRPASSLA